MGILGTVVRSQPLLMRAGQAKMPKSGSIRAQLVSRQQFGHEALFPEELAHQPECCPLVAAALNQHVENLALVIDSAPQIHPLSGNPDDWTCSALVERDWLNRRPFFRTEPGL